MESSSSSTARITERLIQNVQRRQFLYDQESPMYRDTEMRTRAWEEIGKELNVSADEAKVTWDKLRRCFSNALNRRRQCTSRARKTWRYHKQLEFLEPHVDYKKYGPSASVDDFLEVNIKEEPFADGEVPGIEALGPTGNREMPIFSLVDPASLMIKEEPIDEMEEALASLVNTAGAPAMRRLRELNPEKRSGEAPDDECTSQTKRAKSRGFDYVDVDDGPVNSRYPYRNAEITMTQRNPPQTFAPWNMDDTDMFFLSMSRMTKKLTLLQQAHIKSRLSHEVLQAVIEMEERDSAADNLRKKFPLFTKLKKVIQIPVSAKTEESGDNQVLKPSK